MTIDQTTIMLAVGRGNLDADPELKTVACSYLAKAVLATTGQELVAAGVDGVLSSRAVEEVTRTCRHVTWLIDTGVLPDPRTDGAEEISDRYFAERMGEQ